MKRGIGTIVVVSVVWVAAGRAAEEAGWTGFGAGFTLHTAIPARELLADPAAYAGKTVRVRGTVSDVCRKRGCWMVLAEQGRSVRVTMKDYGFFVPTDSAGATADLEGTLIEKPADPEAEAHYAAESANPDAAPRAEAGHKTYELVATAIRLKK
jgi:hypothetical protein